MYLPILFLHSSLRWLIVIGACTVGWRSWSAWRRRLPWGAQHERQHVALVAAVDTQLTLGLWLYFSLSPLPHAFWAAPAVGMHQTVLRFFGIEHVTGMLTAVVLLHVGRVRSKRAGDDAERHRRVWTSTVAALVIVLLSIPWPFLRYGRPLLRLPHV